MIECILTEIDGAVSPDRGESVGAGQIYPDAAGKLHDWYERGLSLSVYAPLPAAANEVSTYCHIADELKAQRTGILYLSASAAALDAAQRAGYATRWLVRGGEPDPAARHVQITRFDAVDYWLLGG